MRMRTVVLIAFVSFAIGAASASWLWRAYCSQVMSHGFAVRTEAGILTKETVLEYLRAGQIANATRVLEMLFDADLIGAGSLAHDGTKFSQATINAVTKERNARNESGYASADKDVRAAVEEAFRLVPASPETAAAQPAAPGDALPATPAGSLRPSASGRP